MEHELFQVFEKEEHIHMEYLPLLTNYICGSLNSHYLPNRSYYYQQYNYVTKLKIVCMWKQNTVYQLFLVKERQKNIKIAFAQQFE